MNRSRINWIRVLKLMSRKM